MKSQKSKIISAFDNASTIYEYSAGLQKIVARNLVERILSLKINNNPTILEVGCGTGFLTRLLINNLAAFKGASLIVSDVTPSMLKCCRKIVKKNSF